MPKSTFFKLTEEKQKNLIDAAMYEFARSTFDEVKISNIIKLAKIPRSSFYDYFDDKEDLFRHLLSIIKEKKQSYMVPFLQKESSSFFESFHELLKAGALFAAKHPEYEKIAKKLYENKQLMQEILGEDQQSVVSIYEGLINSGIQSGELKPNLDAKFISECIYHLTANFVDGFKDNSGETVCDSINKKSEKLLSLLKDGIGDY
ncbi:TetR/AcrR family transcriptional regulator [Bacillus sp. FJAT-45350]|uniref:TetR/AcrR family transcriptional regulator n=1 Tax=Bacillus sp. FJAT-45350 TaxID=2011014 RepID=UPI0015C972DF|nr:TetR/AcrR family transcriptional regulator [Bacillus sp. FJAT-45350]